MLKALRVELNKHLLNIGLWKEQIFIGIIFTFSRKGAKVIGEAVTDKSEVQRIQSPGEGEIRDVRSGASAS